MHCCSFVDGSPGDQLLLSLRCTALTTQRPGCNFESCRMQDVLERLEGEQDVHHTPPHKVGWHGGALYQIGREAPAESLLVTSEGAGRKIIHLPPCLRDRHARHYGFHSSYSKVRKRTPPALRPATWGHPPYKGRPTIDHAIYLVDQLRDINDHPRRHLKLPSDRMKTH